MCVLLIKVPIQKKSGNLFNDPCMLISRRNKTPKALIYILIILLRLTMLLLLPIESVCNRASSLNSVDSFSLKLVSFLYFKDFYIGLVKQTSTSLLILRMIIKKKKKKKKKRKKEKELLLANFNESSIKYYFELFLNN